MPVWKQQNSFTGGEISPRLEGRTDLKQYGNSVAELENFFPHSYGGIAKAPGLYFVCETKDSTKTSRLIPFERKIGQTYVIELGGGYMRFVRDGAQILDSNGDPYEIVSPYSEDEIWNIGFCQSIDVMWITHEDHPPQRLSRFSETDWTITEETFVDGPFMPLNPTTTKLGFSAATGSITVTANATNGINGGQGFLSTDIGRHIRVYNLETDPVQWAWLEITAITSTIIVTATVMGGECPTVNPTDLWKLGEFSETTGWPRSVMFFEQRICYAGTVYTPQGAWLSQTDAYNIFTVSDPVVDSDACSFILVADQTNDIAWMMASRELAIGTIGGEWTLSGAEGKVISPTSVNAKRYTTSGGTNIRPIHVGGSILFVDRSKRAVLEMAYVFEDDGYNSPDLLLLADHITRETQLVDTAFQGSPDSKLYCVLDDGTLAVLVYKRDQQVIGWARRSTQGLFEATVTVSSSYRDVPYFIVNRTIDGVTRRFIEWMKADFGDAVEDNPFLPGGTLPVGQGDLFGAGGGDSGTLGSGSYLWEIDKALDGNQITGPLPQPHPLSDFNYRTQFGTRIFDSSTRDFRHSQAIIGKIGTKVYFYYHDVVGGIWTVKEYDTFTSVMRTWDMTGMPAIGNSRTGNYIGGACIGWDKSTNTKTLYFVLSNDTTGSNVVHVGVFNDSTTEIAVDTTTGPQFDIQADSPPTSVLTDAYISQGYSGGSRLGVNGKYLFIPMRNQNTLGNWQSGILILEHSDMGYTGFLDTLQMWMQNPITVEHNSPQILCQASDGFLYIIHDHTRETAADTPDKSVYMEIHQLVDDVDGDLTTYRLVQDLVDLESYRTDGYGTITALNHEPYNGGDCIFALEDMAIDGDKIYLSWFGEPEQGSFISKFKVTAGSSPWDIDHLVTLRNGVVAGDDRCGTYFIIIDQQDGYT